MLCAMRLRRSRIAALAGSAALGSFAVGCTETGGGAAGGIPDAGGEVPDDEHRLVAEELELAQLLHHHGVAEMDVWRGRVDPEFHPQRAAFLERNLTDEMFHQLRDIVLANS